MSQKQFMPGYLAISEACYASGVEYGSGYPGFPCIEIIDTLKSKDQVYCEWSANEKVAFESAIGASLMGKRSIVSMKTVGLNVAADPFFAFSGSKVNGGFVIFACDDVGRLAGDDMNDSREYALAADIPLIVPGDAQEAYDFLPEAFTLSEQYNTPVFFRLSSVVTHTGMVVNQHLDKPYVNPKTFDPLKHGYSPKTVTGTIATIHKDTELYNQLERMYKDHPKIMNDLSKWSDVTKLNKMEINDTRIGFICSGTAYQFAKEVFPNASYLRIGLVHPLPEKTIRSFASQVTHLFVLEESKPLIEQKVRALGITLKNGNYFKREAGIYRLDPTFIKEQVEKALKEHDPKTNIHPLPQVPYRLPVNCAGCAHRNAFYLLKKHNVKVMGDSGCYTLNMFPPMDSIHNFVCMGAAVGLMHGYEKGIQFSDSKEKVVSVCGDGAFLHTGVNSLLNVAYNKGTSLYIILDNHGLSMTGGHGTPGNGQNANGQFDSPFDIKRFCETLKIPVSKVDPYNLKETERILLKHLEDDGPGVIIMDHPCEKRHSTPKRKTLTLNPSLCNGCQACIQTNCLALSINPETKVPSHNPELCNACGICEDICQQQAFTE